MSDTAQAYYEITVTAPDISREAVVSKLMDMCGSGCFERDGALVAYIPGQSDIDLITADLEAFKSTLKASGLDPHIAFTCARIAGKNWNSAWKKYFKPVDVGKSITVLPPWLDLSPGRISIVIDPGMAFGTGQHETTWACLAMLERLSKEYQEGTFLDVGTGTGILAIGASKMGFSQVTAIDTDPAAVDAVRRNVHLNALSNVTILNSGIAGIKAVFDVIAVNLYSEILKEIAGDIASMLTPSGTAILSGMLEDQAGDIEKSYAEAGLSIVDRIVRGSWVTVAAQQVRRNSADTD